MEQELSIEELLGFREEPKEKEEDLFQELENRVYENEEDILKIKVEKKNNTNDLLSLFNEESAYELLKELEHPVAHYEKVVLEEDENLHDIHVYIKNAHEKRDRS